MLVDQLVEGRSLTDAREIIGPSGQDAREAVDRQLEEIAGQIEMQDLTPARVQFFGGPTADGEAAADVPKQSKRELLRAGWGVAEAKQLQGEEPRLPGEPP